MTSQAFVRPSLRFLNSVKGSMRTFKTVAAIAVTALVGMFFGGPTTTRVLAQSATQVGNLSANTPTAPLTLPKDYVIGVEDVLNVVFWRDKDLSAEVVVRPDGKISLPMLNDVTAAGMTPED